MRNIRRRRAGRFAGAALALLMAFASVVAAAHACTFRDVVTQGSVQVASTGNAMPGCNDTPANPGGDANACAFHCTSGNVPDLQPVLPATLYVASSPLRIEVPDAPSRPAVPYELTALAATPPPLLRFARLLI
jgi:hypothetical protein